MKERQPTLIRSVRRASAMLEYVARHPTGRTASETAQALALPLPTVHHILNTLVYDGLLAKTPERRYRLGPVVGMMAEGLLAQASAPEYLVELLRELADRTGDTAYLSAWRDGDVVLLSIIDGRRAVRVAGLYVGYRGAAHSRASGKVLLANASPEVVDAYLTNNPLESAECEARFRLGLCEARVNGYAIDEEEFAAGVACIAAPVADKSMAIGISVPMDRYRAERDALISAVVSVAAGEATESHALAS